MGYFANGYCFPTRDAALSGLCNVSPFINEQGTHGCVGWTGTAANAGTLTLRSLGTGGASRFSYTAPYTLSVCDEAQSPNFPWNLSISDGSTIAFAIVGAWLLGVAARAVRRVLSGGGESEKEIS